MKSAAKSLSVSLVALLLCACGTGGRPAFISDRGVSQEVANANGTDPNGDGLLYQFKLAAIAAKPYSSANQLVTNDPVKQRAFMDAGFALIYARCNSYILAKSDNQRTVNVWRDTFAPITALLTGALALTSSGEDTNKDLLTALSLGTSAATAGFRIYEQRYLFGAENVNSVRRLILKALNDNAIEASKTENSKMTYSQAVVHLVNNQSVCSPGHILELVNGAIKTGEVVSIKSDDSGADKPATPPSKAEAERDALAALVEQLKKDQVVSDQAIANAKAAIAAGQPAPAATPTPGPGLETVTTKIVGE